MAKNPLVLYQEWKVPLSQSKYSPHATLVSLFDLMFYEKNKKVFARFLDISNKSTIEERQISWKSKGYELEHNIIVFNSNLYRLPDDKADEACRKIYTNETDELFSPFEDWARTGFDICLPKFDRRTKPLFINASNVTKYTKVSVEDYSNFVDNYNPKKLLSNDFYFAGEPTIGIKVFDKDSTLKPKTSADFYANSVLRNSTETPFNDWADYTPYKVALENDYDFLLDGELFDCIKDADIILSNRDIVFEERFLKKESGMWAYNGLCVNYNSWDIWRNFFKYYGLSPDKNSLIWPMSVNSANNEATFSNPLILYLLKQCFVYVKASYFADYIDYRDFDQQLNKTSKVIHNNLMLTDVGDYKRYDTLFSEGKITELEKAKATRPYFPSSTPSIDKIARDMNIIDSNKPKNLNINELIAIADDPSSKIGAIPIEPFESDQISDANDETFTNNYDENNLEPPPVWFDPESRKVGADYNDYPIIFPKDGNLHMNGRILSPTIDELWEMIKRLVSGRQADTITPTEVGYPRNNTPAKQIDFDTRPAIRNHTFTNINEKDVEGDPLIMTLDQDQDGILRYRVEKWVNDPAIIAYILMQELQDLNTVIENNAVAETVVAAFNRIKVITEYAPSSLPLSLRELEALIKGIRYNFATYIRDQQERMAFNGKYGRHNTSDATYNQSNGSLYFLHKKYNPDTFNVPNTVYDEQFNRDISGIAYGIGLGDITNSHQKDRVPSWSTYLGADGQWHSTRQCLLVPVRDDEIF